MKLATQNRRSAFVLILLAVLLLFTVVGFAAGKSTTYYLFDPDNGETIDSSWIKLDEENQWELCITVEEGEQRVSGRYEQNGTVVALFAADPDSEEKLLVNCTLENGELTFTDANEPPTVLHFRARASSESTSEATTSGVATFRGYVSRGVEHLKSANYIGNACKSAFDGLANIKDYWWIIIGVIALIESFFGFRLFRIELAIFGFIGGFVGGLFLYPVLENLIPAMANVPSIQLVIAAILGIAGLLLTQFFFKAAVVIAVGYAGYLFSQPYLVEYQNALLLRILIGVGAAILAFLLLKFIIILITGLFGGMLAIVQLTCKIGAIQKPLLTGNAIVSRIFDVTAKLGLGFDALTVALIIGAVVGVLGMVFQFANTARKRA